MRCRTCGERERFYYSYEARVREYVSGFEVLSQEVYPYETNPKDEWECATCHSFDVDTGEKGSDNAL